MGKYSGFERLLGWLRARAAGPSADADPADVGTAYGMELCLHAQDEAQRSPGHDRKQSGANAKGAGKHPASRKR